SDAQLGQIVLRTRRAVDDDGNAQHTIRTVPGFGYRWVAETRTSAVHAQSAHTEAPTPITASPSSRHRAIAIAALAVVVIVASLALLRLRHVDTPTPGARDALHADSIVVLPIEVDGLREDGWVRLGAMDLVADRLREAGMTVPPSESVLTLLRV